MSKSVEPVYSRIGVLFHIHAYALSKALANVVGSGQAVLAKPYADSFVKLCEAAGFKLGSVSEFAETLKEMQAVEDLKVKRLEDGTIEVGVEGCTFAPIVHKALNMKGYTGDICPLALMTMIAIAKENGWKPGENLFRYIRFAGKLSYFTENGATTIFRRGEA